MALVELACPHCGFSKELAQELLPPKGTTVTCPKCRGQFPLLLGPAAPPGPAAGPGAAWAGAGTPATAKEGWLDGAAPPPLPAAGLPAADPPERSRTLSFSFTGDAREYFGIWIVNTLLRIVTFGIYSPWAKVRKRRYFYANTQLDQAAFDYLADPLSILKGWLIAGAFFGLYSFASRTSAVAALAMGLLFLGLYPWVKVRSRMFSLLNSSHRNIRFSFSPNYQEAYRVYLWWTLLVPLTLGFLAPYLVYRQKRFLVENSRYGTSPFRFHATAQQYYRVFLPLLVLVPLALAAVAGGVFLLPKGSTGSPLALVPPLFMTGCYLLGMAYLPVALANLTWSSTSIGRHRFSCTLRVRDMVGIYLSNALAVLCSLGLLAPWAAVRMARYRLDNLRLTGVGRLDSIVADQQEALGATGEELGDMLGFDLGL